MEEELLRVRQRLDDLAVELRTPVCNGQFHMSTSHVVKGGGGDFSRSGAAREEGGERRISQFPSACHVTRGFSIPATAVDASTGTPSLSVSSFRAGDTPSPSPSPCHLVTSDARRPADAFQDPLCTVAVMSHCACIYGACHIVHAFMVHVHCACIYGACLAL